MGSVTGRMLLAVCGIALLVVFGVGTMLQASSIDDGKVSFETKSSGSDGGPLKVVRHGPRGGHAYDYDFEDEGDDEYGDDEGSDEAPCVLYGVQDTDLADSTLLRFDLIAPITGDPISDLTHTWP